MPYVVKFLCQRAVTVVEGGTLHPLFSLKQIVKAESKSIRLWLGTDQTGPTLGHSGHMPRLHWS